MTPSLKGIDQKLNRAVTHINNLDQAIERFRDKKPWSVRVQKDTQDGKPVGRLVAVKNHAVGPPDVEIVLLAGEALCQLRFALNHFIHQLVLLHDPAFKIEDSRQHQFPIFERPDGPHGYATKAGRMIDGVPKSIASDIEREQPYMRHPGNPHDDTLWMLNSLNNTDKHRLIPTCVVGLGHVRGDQVGGVYFTLQSDGGIVLEDNKVFWSFTTPDGRYSDMKADLTPSVAFAEASNMYGETRRFV